MRNKNKKNITISFIKIILFFILIYTSLNECNDITKPIFYVGDNACVMKYCTEEQFENKICIKDNNIIRNQWLNNIIKITDENSTFSQIAKYSNGDIVAFSSNKGKNGISYFYGLKENGRPLFINNYQENPYKTLKVNSDKEIQNDEGEILVVKTESTNEEYIINIQRSEYYIELYDFENESIYFQETYYLFTVAISSNEFYVINSIRGSFLNLKNSNYYIYAGIFDNLILFNKGNNKEKELILNFFFPYFSQYIILESIIMKIFIFYCYINYLYQQKKCLLIIHKQ